MIIFKISKIVNIVGGFVLGSPMLKKNESLRPFVEKTMSVLGKYEKAIGLVELVLGATIIVERTTGLFKIPYLGSTFPQAFVALAIGFMISKQYFGESKLYKTLEPYSDYIGIGGAIFSALTIVF